MQKRKPWQLFLIIAVLILTIYNILPTVFYYSKPLKDPVKDVQAKTVAIEAMKRANHLENETLSWLNSFCSLLKTSYKKIEFNKDNPQEISIQFSSINEAKKFRRFLPRAGALIPFVPSQLLLSNTQDPQSKNVIVHRQIPIKFSLPEVDNFFSFSYKKDASNKPTPLYRDIIFDRSAQIAQAIAGVSDTGSIIEQIAANPESPNAIELLFSLCHDIVHFNQTFKEHPIAKSRYFSSILQITFTNKTSAYNELTKAFDIAKKQIKLERNKLRSQDTPISEENEQQITLLKSKENLLIQSENILKKHEKELFSEKSPWSYADIYQKLQKLNNNLDHLELSLENQNPFFNKLVIDWNNEKIELQLHEDIIALISNQSSHNSEQYSQLLINELAKITRRTDERLISHGTEFLINLNDLTDSKSFLALNLNKIADVQAKQFVNILKNQWHPQHPELQEKEFPIYDYNTYLSLPETQKALCLIIYSPILEKTETLPGMKTNSIYVIARGLDRILEKYKHAASDQAQIFWEDFNQLSILLKQNGFIGYTGTSILSSFFKNDFIFEKSDYYRMILNATRENFSVKGTKRFALLEFTDLEQRILTTNQIETRQHEDLIKWNDEYNSAQVSLTPATKYDIPPLKKSILWNNFILSVKKYFRGDERKILHWGLDLSGGKTVQIELRDQNNSVVKNESDLKQGVNELYNRVNKMGVSEVNIRTIDNNIVLDFPGSNNLSAAELVKASTMYFHVVNEKFTPSNSTLSDNVNRFLQEVWNEAIVTNRTDSESVQAIAWKHLYGTSANDGVIQPQSESAKILYDHGLRLADPSNQKMTSNFDDTTSKIAVFRGKDFTQWQGQTHPLLIVFNNYTLEGSSLENIRGAYDPSKGNFLSFEISSSSTGANGEKIKPRSQLYSWTSHYSKEKIQGTPLETYTHGRGWRMAVILNDSVISAPNLESALRDSAMISGSFSQREVNLLVADLKAGSLSFTPKILSEKNVSPELGKQERTQGILATIIALCAVIFAMMLYYRFSGVIASIAVVFNLLFMWATLQNIQATLSLAGIAGIILTVGMAVDANVLVFERIREEFAFSHKLASSIQVGYKKAFSAIIDSNITTIIAALILLHFDAGPIKGFAITLIIGIISSMFSALFMTRWFFTKWAENTKHKTLNMLNIIKATNFNFLKKAKFAFIFSAILLLCGTYTLIQNRHSILGMDFTGGYSLNLTLQQTEKQDCRQMVEKALLSKGLTHQDFQIRSLNPSNHLRLLLSTQLELSKKPFHDMPIQIENSNAKYPYQNNPRINWVVTTLQDANIHLQKHSLEQLDSTWTAMSGQMSDAMRNNAGFGLLLSMIAILIYITFRFEFKFAVSAIICLLHDVLISIASVAILHFFKVPIQIDLHTIAALMTIIGYSLNDTIIIFDRIREDARIMRKYSYSQIVNHALNVTLSRTSITSLTTLLVLVSLLIFGGSMIFGFAAVMTLGVIFGTLSSLFIASPLMLLFHRREYETKTSKMVSQEEA